MYIWVLYAPATAAAGSDTHALHVGVVAAADSVPALGDVCTVQTCACELSLDVSVYDEAVRRARDALARARAVDYVARLQARLDALERHRGSASSLLLYTPHAESTTCVRGRVVRVLEHDAYVCTSVGDGSERVLLTSDELVDCAPGPVAVSEAELRVDTLHSVRVTLSSSSPTAAAAVSLLHTRQPEELRLCLRADVACACTLPLPCVHVEHVACEADTLAARVRLTHSVRVPSAQLATALAHCTFRSLHALAQRAVRGDNSDEEDDDDVCGGVCGMDALLLRLCDALGVPRSVCAGLTVDEALQPLTQATAARVEQASVAYEGEIADLLALQCGARDELAAMRAAHDRAMAALRHELANSTHREQALTRECAQLLDVTARLKELTVRQDSELQRLRAAQRASASGTTPRMHRVASNAALLSPRVVDDAATHVTMDEYEAQAARCDALAQQLADALQRVDALRAQLATSEAEAAHHRGHAHAVEEALAAREDDTRDALAQLHAESTTLREHARHANARADALHDEVVAFRRHRRASHAARRDVAALPPLTDDDDDSDEYVAVPPDVVSREPLLVASGDEYNAACARAAQLAHALDVLYDKMASAATARDGDASLSCAARMLQLLDDVAAARAVAQGALGLASDKDAQLAQLRDVLAAEDERAQSDLANAREEAARLQRELDVVSQKLNELCGLYSDAGGAGSGAALLAHVEQVASALSAAREAQQAAMQQLSAQDEELATLRSELAGARAAAAANADSERSAYDEVVARVDALTAAQARGDERVAALQRDKVQLARALADRDEELQRMSDEWDALQQTTQELMRELQAQTSKYGDVVGDVEAYAAQHVNGDSERALLNTLAAREQELYELREARRGELDEHAQQVALLHAQLQRLRERGTSDTALCDALQGEVARLRSALAAAESALRERDDEVEELKAGIETIVDEHDAQVRDADAELEAKGREASDALARLEEMSAMLNEARESEASALRLRTLSDNEVFRLQKELDRMQQQQQQQQQPHTQGMSESDGSGAGISSTSNGSGGGHDGGSSSMAPSSDMLHSIHEQPPQQPLRDDSGSQSNTTTSSSSQALPPHQLRDRVRALEQQLQAQKAADDDVIRELCAMLQRTMAALERGGTTMSSSASRLTSARQRVEALVGAA